MPLTKVSFISHKYGNYQDNWYTDDYDTLIATLADHVVFTRNVNLGVSDGVIIENNFNGDFQHINTAIVEHDQYGTHLYKLIKKAFIKRDLWRITMVKDMVSSRYTDLLKSKTLVSRIGLNRDEFDPLLFQDEVIELSQVKKVHNILNELEGTKSYGFLAIWARDSLDGESIIWNSTPREILDFDIVVNGLANFSLYGKKQRNYYDSSVSYTIGHETYAQQRKISAFLTDGTRQSAEQIQPLSSGRNIDDINMFDPSLATNALDFLETVEHYNDYATLMPYIGKIIYDSSTESYYEIKLTLKSRGTTRDLSSAEVQALLLTHSGYTILNDIEIQYFEQYYEMEYEFLVKVPTISHTLSAYVNTIDQPFQMFYIPVIEGATIVYDESNYTTDKYLTQAMIYDLIADYTGEAGKLLDVQILPYSPVDGFTSLWNETTKTFDANTAKETIIVEDNIIPIYEVIYCNYQLNVPYPLTVTDYKLEQKKKYAITSPSGSTVYDFSVAKNKGLQGFNIEVDIRPFSTFHRLQPVYEGLYGANYKDTRGLIWQEDTSLTVITLAWETYKRQNINYLNSFNAEQNLKRSQLTINKQTNWGNYAFDAGKRMIEATVDAAGFAAEAIANDVWFGAKGAVSGAVGAAAIMGGAVASEAIEAGQLAYNNRMDKKLLENEIGVARQQFNYSIGNMQAIPENLEKVNGVFNSNNLVPYIQIFEPTEEEIQYYNDYLDTFGVNVGMMVDLQNKEFNFIQGTLVIYEGVITNEEYEELHHQLSKGARKLQMEV